MLLYPGPLNDDRRNLPGQMFPRGKRSAAKRNTRVPWELAYAAMFPRGNILEGTIVLNQADSVGADDQDQHGGAQQARATIL